VGLGEVHVDPDRSRKLAVPRGPGGEFDVVTEAVSDSDRSRSLSDGGVQDVQVVGHRLGPGVARTDHAGQRLTGGIGEAEHRVEAEAALVGGGGMLRPVGVELDQGYVDV